MSTMSSSMAPTRMRLTRRGRVVLAGMAVLVGLGVAAVADQAFAAAPGDAGGPVASAPAAHATVYVSPGDSLWSIASDISGDRDVRDVVAEISRLNGLAGSVIQAGQELIVPAPVTAQD